MMSQPYNPPPTDSDAAFGILPTEVIEDIHHLVQVHSFLVNAGLCSLSHRLFPQSVGRQITLFMDDALGLVSFVMISN